MLKKVYVVLLKNKYGCSFTWYHTKKDADMAVELKLNVTADTYEVIQFDVTSNKKDSDTINNLVLQLAYGK